MTQRPRNQNRFGAGIDVTIRVVGMFMGWPVASWDEQRTLRKGVTREVGASAAVVFSMSQNTSSRPVAKGVMR